jgi:prepilin signal peptidase PulO-like enzyme (type II secretory pathway)
MDFNILSEYFVLVVLVACLVLGYIIKTSFGFIQNKYIPTILAVFGAILNAVVSGISVETVVYGAVMGLASTGFHQAFKNWVEGKKTDKAEAGE